MFRLPQTKSPSNTLQPGGFQPTCPPENSVLDVAALRQDVVFSGVMLCLADFLSPSLVQNLCFLKLRFGTKNLDDSR